MANDIYQLGPATVFTDEDGFTFPVAALKRQITEKDDGTPEFEDWGQVKVVNALGVTALTSASDADGTGPEGLVIGNVGGEDGVCVAAWDVRAAKELGAQMSPGDTCLHGTHPTDDDGEDRRAKYFAKKNLAAIIVGNDTAFTIDRNAEDISITGFGMKIEMNKTNGIMLSGDGGAYIQIKGGVINIVGNVALGNTNPMTAGAVAIMGPSGPMASLSTFTSG